MPSIFNNLNNFANRLYFILFQKCLDRAYSVECQKLNRRSVTSIPLVHFGDGSHSPPVLSQSAYVASSLQSEVCIRLVAVTLRFCFLKAKDFMWPLLLTHYLCLHGTDTLVCGTEVSGRSSLTLLHYCQLCLKLLLPQTTSRVTSEEIWEPTKCVLCRLTLFFMFFTTLFFVWSRLDLRVSCFYEATEKSAFVYHHVVLENTSMTSLVLKYKWIYVLVNCVPFSS